MALAQKQASHLSPSAKPPFSLPAGSDQSRLVALFSLGRITADNMQELLYRAANPSPIPWGTLLTQLSCSNKEADSQG